MSGNGNGSGPGLVIDRSRITHKEAKRMLILQTAAARAERDMDDALVESILEEMDALTMRVTVSIPGDWLPDGVTLSTPNWIDHLPQNRYVEMQQEMAEQSQPGGKKI